MWVTTAKLSVGQMVSWGLLYYTFSACLPFMEADLGWSTARLSIGFSIALLISGLSAPLLGRWADRYGTRVLMVAGAAMGSVGLALWGWSATFAAYLSAWVLIGLAMAATLYEMAFATVVKAMPRSRRGSIITITLVGALASTLFMPLSSALFVELGWRTGLLVLAGILALVVIPLNASLPVAPVHAPSTPAAPKGDATIVSGTLISETRSRAFWVLGFALMLASVVTVAINTHAIAYFVERGITVQSAATMAGAAGIAKLAGRLATAAGRWFSAAILLRGTLFLQAASLLIPVVLPSTASLLFMMVMFGATSGARTILRPLLIVELFGEGSFATRSGLLQAVATLAKASAPVGAGVLIDRLGFDGAWIGLGLLAFISGGLLFLLPAQRLQPSDVAPGG